MTLKEAKELFRTDTDSYGKPKAIMTKLNLIFKEFDEELKQRYKDGWRDRDRQSDLEHPEGDK